MARGHQKAQSQVKNQEKMKQIKSKQGHNAAEQKKAAAKALTFQCPVCRVSASLLPGFTRCSRTLPTSSKAVSYNVLDSY